MASSMEAQDCEYITPPVNLKSKVREMSPREAGKFDPVAAAEKALAQLSTNFGEWMGEETATLVRIWSAVGDGKLTTAGRDDLFRASHDIKGQAATLGFPVASIIADSLCHLLESVTDPAAIPHRLIEQHVLAMRAIYSEDAREETNPLARELAQQLVDCTEEFIAGHRRQETA